MKTVLVTGASGFVGRHALAALSARGYRIHAAGVEISAPVHCKDATWHVLDIMNEGALTALMSELRPTHLLHFAWDATPGEFWQSPRNLNWVSASLNLVRAFVDNGGVRFVGAGTCAEYEWSDVSCDEATTALRPATLYGVSKNAVHSIVASYARACGLSYAWGRMFLLYGPDEHPARLVPYLVRNSLLRQPAVCRFGQLRRDFLYAPDAGNAFAALLDSDVTGAVNIASGNAVKLGEVAKKIAELCGGNGMVEVREDEPAAGEPLQLVGAIKRLNGEVGWMPRHNLDEGLARTIAWWRAKLAAS